MYADRVQETTTSTGTGNISLAGAAPNMQTINTAVGTNVFFKYAIVHQSSNEWEIGRGYLSGSTTLVRESVQASTNSNALVSFSAGTKDVYITLPADDIESKGVVAALVGGYTMN